MMMMMNHGMMMMMKSNKFFCVKIKIMSCGNKQDCSLAPCGAPCASYVQAPGCYDACYNPCFNGSIGYGNRYPGCYNQWSDCNSFCGLTFIQWIVLLFILFFFIIVIIALVRWSPIAIGAGAGAGVYRQAAYPANGAAYAYAA